MTTKHVLFYVGGCTGSSPAQAVRFVVDQKTGHDTEFLTRPIARNSFGTNTTSFALVVGDIGYLIDNGSGVSQSLDALLASKVKKIIVLQTHYHADHNIGLTSNDVFFMPHLLQVTCGPTLHTDPENPTYSTDLGDVLKESSFKSWNWPVNPAMFKMGHNILSFKPGNTLSNIGGDPGVTTLLLNHPGGAAAYRIPTPHGDVVIATDNEPAAEEDQKRLATFASGAALLYVDMQYRQVEYEGKASIGGGRLMSRVGWGHATPPMIQAVLHRMEVAPKHLLIGHHDPKRSHEDLLAFEGEAQEVFAMSPGNVKVEFARECQIVEI